MTSNTFDGENSDSRKIERTAQAAGKERQRDFFAPRLCENRGGEATGRSRAAANRAGFSLLEVIIAITIIVIVGGVVGVGLLDLPQRSRVSAAKMQLSSFKTAVQLYAADNGIVPTQRQGLYALVMKPTIDPIPQNYKDGGYLDAIEVPLDPWGNEYEYLAPGSHGEAFEIISYGADGAEGGDKFNADLSSSRLNETGAQQK